MAILINKTEFQKIIKSDENMSVEELKGRLNTISKNRRYENAMNRKRNELIKLFGGEVVYHDREKIVIIMREATNWQLVHFFSHETVFKSFFDINISGSAIGHIQLELTINQDKKKLIIDNLL